MRNRGTGKTLRFGVRLLFCILSLPILSLAANHYVRAGATGNGSGSDWTNAYTDLPSSLVRGDTYYIAAGTYGWHTFNDATSGSTYITVKSATVTDHGTGTGWSDSYAGKATMGALWFKSGFYNISGSTRTSMTSGYGMVVDMSNVNSISKCGGFGSCTGIWIQGGYPTTNINLSYLQVKGYGYSTSTCSGTSNCVYGFLAVQGEPKYGGTISNISFTYSYINDFGACQTMWDTGDTSNFTFDHSELDTDHYTSGCHEGGLVSHTGDNNFTISNSVFHNMGVTAIIEILNSGTSGTDDSWAIYGNIFYNDSSSWTVGDGAIACINNNTCTNFLVYNNTFSGLSAQLSSGVNWSLASSGSVTVNNNIWHNSVNCGAQGAGATADYDYFNGCTGTTPSETHMQVANTDPFTNDAGGDFHLLGGTNAGVTLPSPYNVDPTGATRGADGTWDRGAYEFLGNVTKPNAPSGLTVTGVS
jgi:hypothetical protein